MNDQLIIADSRELAKFPELRAAVTLIVTRAKARHAKQRGELRKHVTDFGAAFVFAIVEKLEIDQAIRDAITAILPELVLAKAPRTKGKRRK